MSYDQLAEQLVPYAADMGYTHLEFLPVSEHPFDPSWGYQPTGSSRQRRGRRSGRVRPAGQCRPRSGPRSHPRLVPAHFPTDEFASAISTARRFMSTPTRARAFHPDWNTAIYNFGRKEVSSFLTNNALYWFEAFHIDGLRVDAVASMLYLDYSRQAGQWVPNQHGGNENIEAVAFLKRVNAEVYRQFPGAIHDRRGIHLLAGRQPPHLYWGARFRFKWNMGFMNDTLRFMSAAHPSALPPQRPDFRLRLRLQRELRAPAQP